MLFRSPGDGSAWAELGLALDAHMFLEKAEASLEVALDIDSAHRRAAYDYAVLGTLLPRDASDVTARFVRATEMMPGYAPGFARLGQHLLANDEAEAAADAFRRPLSSPPTTSTPTPGPPARSSTRTTWTGPFGPGTPPVPSFIQIRPRKDGMRPVGPSSPIRIRANCGSSRSTTPEPWSHEASSTGIWADPRSTSNSPVSANSASLSHNATTFPVLREEMH